jgi:hypothetical protein
LTKQIKPAAAAAWVIADAPASQAQDQQNNPRQPEQDIHRMSRISTAVMVAS